MATLSVPLELSSLKRLRRDVVVKLYDSGVLSSVDYACADEIRSIFLSVERLSSAGLVRSYDFLPSSSHRFHGMERLPSGIECLLPLYRDWSLRWDRVLVGRSCKLSAFILTCMVLHENYGVRQLDKGLGLGNGTSRRILLSTLRDYGRLRFSS